MSRCSRLPVRIRVTLAFAGVMAVVLMATGLFLYLRLGAELDTAIEQSLRSRAGDVTALIEQADSGLEEAGRSALTEQGESFAQILDPSGGVVDATPAVRGRALLEGEQLPDEVGETVIVDREAIPGEDDPVRVLATPVRAQDRRSSSSSALRWRIARRRCATSAASWSSAGRSRWCWPPWRATRRWPRPCVRRRVGA
jgi:hypothetical protein